MFPNSNWSSPEGKALPVFTFSFLFFPPNFCALLALDTGHPMGPSNTRGRVEVSEPLRNERRWDSDSYSVWGNAKLLPQCTYTVHRCLTCRYYTTQTDTRIKHTPMPPFCYGTVYIRVSSREASRILQSSGTFFYVVCTQYS